MIKNSIYFIFVLLLFTACGSNDDAEVTVPDAVSDSVTVNFVVDSYTLIEGEAENETFSLDINVMGGIIADDAFLRVEALALQDSDFYDNFSFRNGKRYGELIIPSGDYRAPVTFSVNLYLSDDCVVEADTSYIFTLTGETNNFFNIGGQNNTTIVVEDDDVDISDFLSGRIYDRTSFVLASAMDLNGDGIFSFDIDSEIDCIDPLLFEVYPFEISVNTSCYLGIQDILQSFPIFTIIYDSDNNPIQQSNCAEFELVRNRYELNGVNLTIFNNSTGSIGATGVFSNDFTEITITFAGLPTYPNYNLYLAEDGTVQTYLSESGAVATYVLRN